MAAALAAATVLASGCARSPSTSDAGTADRGELARLHAAARVVDLCLLVADTGAERQRGLSARDSLGPYDGMLFVFDSMGQYRFWMKDTTIPLDLVPLGPGGELQSPLPMDPCPGGTVCPQFGPATPYDRALELPQGFLSGAGVDPTASTVTLERVGTECPAAGDG